ncbi:nucleolar MIF4G domain-containing protein 1-like [Hibiscus syriacus]|uniref:Nucleolar MIF4G domain-containing protein 1-like n=1 Tax=Hibiscus syriacus TaxID=106335 RepID=A0A6A2ZAF0_HIBSY|nr:nucleolar MIF4G domain-containing protein 1-like [Hibiscus syriacus]
MARTPSSSSKLNQNHMRTPQSKHRLNFIAKENPPGEHPVEVIGRIRNYPGGDDNQKDKIPISFLHINPDSNTLRVRADIGYRDFSLDGVSSSEEEGLDVFYKKFIESRINGVKMGAKCTIMMYGPTGSGKSHTMAHFGVQFDIYIVLCSFNVKLEVMGKRVKNATFISGDEAGKISKEIQKVEKRRIVKSTFCNERSSRSHCMADACRHGGIRKYDQAGQTGFEAKMQTAKINQGNIALKRVVESIANGDSHVPFRDSKLTMLLQDSFEDDQSKILMILCASPDPKDIHKTVCTLEYGAKAKCIVRGPHTPNKDKNEDSSSAVILGSRVAAMDQFIHKLQMENKLREKQRNEPHKELLKKEEEAKALRALVERKGSSGASEEEINAKVNKQTQILKLELEKRLHKCRQMAEEFVEMERRRMEERILQQQEEVEMLRRRLREIEFELCRLRGGSNGEENEAKELDGGSSSFAKRLIVIYGDEIPGMVKSMDLDIVDPEPVMHQSTGIQGFLNHPRAANPDGFAPQFGSKTGLSTVYEEEEIEEEEVEKLVIEEKMVCSSEIVNDTIMSESSPLKSYSTPTQPDSDSSRLLRIQNIFTLCGNQRQLSQEIRTQTSPMKILDKENSPPGSRAVPLNGEDCIDSQIEVNVKWEASKENPGNVITAFKVVKDATLADLRKLIEIYLAADNQAFTFLLLGDPTGPAVKKENEATVKASKLPLCSNGYLACLRPAKDLQITNQLPLTPMENKLPLTPNNSILVSR